SPPPAPATFLDPPSHSPSSAVPPTSHSRLAPCTPALFGSGNSSIHSLSPSRPSPPRNMPPGFFLLPLSPPPSQLLPSLPDTATPQPRSLPIPPGIPSPSPGDPSFPKM